MKYVIVGNGPAGTGAVEGLREVDEAGSITVISDEKIVNYSKPLITYWLAGKIKTEQMAFRREDFYKKNAVNLLLGQKAVKLDVKRKLLFLGNRERIPFDRLLIATGGMPISPPADLKKMKGIFTFTQMADAENISRYLENNPTRQALVVGGGLIGLKATEALIERGIEITIVELADRILSATFDRRASGIIEEVLKSRGCRVILGTTIQKFGRDRQGKLKEAILQNRMKISCGLVVWAVGVLPNVEWLKGSGVQIDRGIQVDSTMESSAAGIYAAGDCCQTGDFFGGMNRIIPIWPNAVRQGRIAGYHMAGRPRKYEGPVAMNSVELCGVPTISFGLTDPPSEEGFETIEFQDGKRSIYKKLVLRDDIIVGALFIGDISRAGVYTGLMKESMKVTDFKELLLKENFGLIHLPKDYRKHSVTGEGIVI